MKWIGYEELVDGEWVERRWVMGMWVGRHGQRGKMAKRKGGWQGGGGPQYNRWRVHLIDLESRHSICGKPKMEVIEDGSIEYGEVNDKIDCLLCLEYAIDLRNAVRAYEGQLFRAWQQG